MHIFKYKVGCYEKTTIHLPPKFRWLHAGLDPQGDMCVWAAVPFVHDVYPVEVVVKPTGPHVLNGDEIHIGTVKDGELMWHIFQLPQFK